MKKWVLFLGLIFAGSSVIAEELHDVPSIKAAIKSGKSIKLLIGDKCFEVGNQGTRHFKSLPFNRTNGENSIQVTPSTIDNTVDYIHTEYTFLTLVPFPNAVYMTLNVMIWKDSVVKMTFIGTDARSYERQFETTATCKLNTDLKVFAS